MIAKEVVDEAKRYKKRNNSWWDRRLLEMGCFRDNCQGGISILVSKYGEHEVTILENLIM
jgi:hypothetical protein